MNKCSLRSCKILGYEIYFLGIFQKKNIMSTIVARTGRQRQRYEDNFRLVSGCIPYRLVGNDGDQSFELENSIEVLMISSPNRDDLVFPKGGWEDDETVEEAARREALEEAGVRGIIKGDSLGDWKFRSKSKQEMCSLEGGCKVHMFALEVTKELDVWPEQENHDRKWLLIKEAFHLCRYEWMSAALEKFLQVMATDEKPERGEDVMELHPAPVSDIVSECPIMSTNCLPSLLSQKKNVFQPFECPAPQC